MGRPTAGELVTMAAQAVEEIGGERVGRYEFGYRHGVAAALLWAATNLIRDPLDPALIDRMAKLDAMDAEAGL